jgi:hypothetical protein
LKTKKGLWNKQQNPNDPAKHSPLGSKADKRKIARNRSGNERNASARSTVVAANAATVRKAYHKPAHCERAT